MCPRTKDLVGHTYGYLTVLEFMYYHPRSGAIWKCRCKCEKIKLAVGSKMKAGNTNSCGCYQKERSRNKRLLDKGEAGFRDVLRGYKRGAKSRGLEWQMSVRQFKKLTKSNCVYCDSPPAAERISSFNMSHSSQQNGKYKYNGIDRIDSSKGYIAGNVVSCCTLCNRIKLNHDLDLLMHHLKKMVRTYKG